MNPFSFSMYPTILLPANLPYLELLYTTRMYSNLTEHRQSLMKHIVFGPTALILFTIYVLLCPMIR
jgi:hypothetical protein